MKLGVDTAILHDRWTWPSALAGLDAYGNPLPLNLEVGPRHAEDLLRSIRADSMLGQTRLVPMPASRRSAGHHRPLCWTFNACHSGWSTCLW